MEIKCPSVCNRKYVTINVTVLLVIYSIFSIIFILITKITVEEW